MDMNGAQLDKLFKQAQEAGGDPRDIVLSVDVVKKFADKRGISIEEAMDLIVSTLNED